MAKKATQKQVVTAAARRHGVPAWLLWGIYGAESTWGTNGTNYFGLIEGSYSGRTVKSTTNLAEDADIAAELLARLKKENGSWAAAVTAYSGNSYDISHPKSLSTGGSSSGSQLVDIETPFGNIPLPGPNFNLEDPLGSLGNAATEGIGKGGELLEKSGIPGIQQLGEISKFFNEASKLLFTPEGWLQVGQVAGGLILIGWGLHRLVNVSTGVDVAHGVKKTGLKAAELAAVVK